jgi:hypothetical protein
MESSWRTVGDMAAEVAQAKIAMRAQVPGVLVVQGVQGARRILILIVEEVEVEAMEARVVSEALSVAAMEPMAMRTMAGTAGINHKAEVISAKEVRGMAVVVVVVEAPMETSVRIVVGPAAAGAEVRAVRPRFSLGIRWGKLGDMGPDWLVAKEGIILPTPGHAMDAMADIMSPVQMAIIPLMLASTWEVEVEVVESWIRGVQEDPEAVAPAGALWP